MNYIHLTGNLVRDPELKTAGATKLVKFSLAVRRRFKDKQTNEYKTDFFNCTVFGAPAENLARYQRKGNKLAVTGRLEINQYQAQDGSNRYDYQVMADDIEYLTTQKEQQANNNNNNTTFGALTPKDDFLKDFGDPFETTSNNFDLDGGMGMYNPFTND